MLQSYKRLLSLILSLVGFGIALIMVVFDVNIAARIICLIVAFFSGWNCCYSLGVILGEITEQETSK